LEFVGLMPVGCGVLFDFLISEVSSLMLLEMVHTQMAMILVVDLKMVAVTQSQTK